jgi:divalent metal cation (Fe/Co/Zn/Cd) transporter
MTNDKHQGVFTVVLSLGVNIVLATVKCLVGVVANSHALIADGIHSSRILLEISPPSLECVMLI